jgi:hypothetical protein
MSDNEKEYIRDCKTAEKIQDTQTVRRTSSVFFNLLFILENTMGTNVTITRLLVYSHINGYLRFWSLWFVDFILILRNLIIILTAIWAVVPEYMNAVLLFSIRENGLLSALPHVASFIVVMLTGGLADLIIKRKWLKRVNTRKAFHGIGTLSPAICLLLISFLDCEHRYLAVLLLVIGVALK